MKLPIVAIVGRTNVGKSTLFNRIIQRREAIVHDQPGVTRDRNYAISDWIGKQFILMDTGGYISGSQNVIDKAVFDQVHLAIDEADVVIFVVDGTTGPTALDEEITQVLKKSGKNILLAVNKIDSEQRESLVSEFYALSLGDPVSISAISGRRIGDFLDQIVVFFPQQSSSAAESEHLIRLAVLGRPNVGKSSFVNSVLGVEKQIVTEIPGTTRDAIDTEFRYYGQDFLIIDTAGLRKRARVKENVEFYSNVRALDSLRRCHVAVILLDSIEGITDQDKKIIDSAIKEKRGIVIAVNKWDLVQKDTMTAKRMEAEIKTSLGKASYLPIHFISALTRQRVFKVIEVAQSVYQERKKRVRTSELNKFLQEVLEMNPPPAYGQKWVKINYCSQIRVEPPAFVFFTNEPLGIKNNYKAYLENQLRQKFGFLGVPISLRFRKK